VKGNVPHRHSNWLNKIIPIKLYIHCRIMGEKIEIKNKIND